MDPHVRGGAEAGGVRDAFDGDVRRLQQSPRVRDALLREPALRRHAGTGAEAAHEGTRAHQRVRGHLLDRERLVEVVDDPVEGRTEDRRLGRVRYREIEELRLAAVAVRGHDHPTRNRVRHPAAEVGAHDVERQVDRSRGTGRREDGAVVDVQDVGEDADLGMARREERRVHPVRGGASPVEHTRGRERERAAAERHHAGAARVRGAQRFEERR